MRQASVQSLRQTYDDLIRRGGRELSLAISEVGRALAYTASMRAERTKVSSIKRY
jgi:hypothetical protein